MTPTQAKEKSMNENHQLQKEQAGAVARPIDLPRMFDMAMERGPEGVQMLKELVVLRREMEEEAAKREYTAAMVKTQAEMPTVIKSSRNPSNNSSYVKFEHLDEVARPIYQSNGFSLEYSERECPTPEKIRIACKVSHVRGHFEEHFLDGSPDDTGAKGAPNKTKIQGQGSTFSYLQRYLLKMIFNMRTVGEDNDGQGARTVKPRGPEDSTGQTQTDTDPLKKRLWNLLLPVRGAARTWETAEGWLEGKKIIRNDQSVSKMTAEELAVVIDNAELALQEGGR
jgi:hypothetical protein